MRRILGALAACLVPLIARAELVEFADAVDVKVGPEYACALTTAGGVKCWGNGFRGDGGGPARWAAGDVAGLTSGVTTIAVGWTHSCAVLASGGIKCWGSNVYGELGDGTAATASTPVDVANLGGQAIAVAAGWYHTCALSSGGGVKCWGDNRSGQLGDGTFAQRADPTDVAGLTSGVAVLAAGPRHTCAVTMAGAVKCWGANGSGELGDGTTTPRALPADVATLSIGAASVALGGTVPTQSFSLVLGGGHSCAVMTSGGVKCWGRNASGELGDGTNVDRLTPFDVAELTGGVSSVSANGMIRSVPGTSNLGRDVAGRTCAMTVSGAAKCWGDNHECALGRGEPENCFFPRPPNYSSPQDVVGLGPVVSVSTGGNFNCAVQADGRVKCWGVGYGNTPVGLLSGQLPQAINFPAQSPLAVGDSRMMNATGGPSNNPVTFSTLTPGTCTVSGSTVNGTAAGLCTVAADQAGNDYYDAAPQVTRQFRIGDPQPQAITFGPAPAVVVNGVGQLSATASSGLTVAFVSSTPSICTVSGATVTGVAVGSCTVVASQNGDMLYGPAPQQTQTFPVGANTGTLILSVSKGGDGAGTVTSTPAGIDCGTACAGNFTLGSSVSLTPSPATGSLFTGWTGACTGSGACNVTTDAAKSVGAAFHVFASSPRLGNISTRGQVLTGNDVMIGGFVIGGSGSKTVVVRARGPSLAAFGVANAMANPMLQLVRSSDQATLASNDDWGTAANAAQLSATGFAPSNALEAAILVTLPEGAYTAIVSGSGGTTGVGIVEVFEVDHPEMPLANISTRGQVQNGDDVLIGGFVIQGLAPQTVVIRARGPSLAPFGITNALSNPTLLLFSGSTLIGSNDDWGTATNAAQISASGFAPSDSLESAMLVTLAPGAYTAIVTRGTGATGVGIVEVFRQ